MQLNTLIVIVLLSGTITVAQERKISSKVNPGCKTCTNDTILMYVRCDGASDTIHQIWDFTRSIPTVIFAVTKLKSSLDIVWDGNNPTGFYMSETPLYSFATALDKIYEYNDLKDNGHFDPNLPHHIHNLDHMMWHVKEISTTEKEAMVRVYGTLNNDRSEEHGTVAIKLDLIPFKDYAVELPHLIHTANSTQFDVSLVNLTSTPGYNASRFALHLLLVSTDSATETMRYTMRKSLDDEHTPGVFEVIEIKTPALHNYAIGGYLQFRPVGYVQAERGVASSTIAHVSYFNRTSLPVRSTMKTFYDEFGRANLLVQDMMVSFGEGGDGYYAQHNYTAWSFAVGYGSPPTDSFSWYVVLIISGGLLLPVLLAVSGMVYVLVRRHRQRYNSRAMFANED
ncbi:glycosylated lysosomal membrane protein B [Bicyclus anynana]|uniref:Glycosylated lysosomal membrane protein B n=1 Tax=Bicyclus anynana TaxID=110368 RepID=A0A6J1NB02_BICAN|nr:glycosylated lysosomal membrane protein B [Bicyclus anynana]